MLALKTIKKNLENFKTTEEKITYLDIIMQKANSEKLRKELTMIMLELKGNLKKPDTIETP